MPGLGDRRIVALNLPLRRMGCLCSGAFRRCGLAARQPRPRAVYPGIRGMRLPPALAHHHHRWRSHPTIPSSQKSPDLRYMFWVRSSWTSAWQHTPTEALKCTREGGWRECGLRLLREFSLLICCRCSKSALSTLLPVARDGPRIAGQSETKAATAVQMAHQNPSDSSTMVISAVAGLSRRGARRAETSAFCARG